jgi:hypothetical protein
MCGKFTPAPLSGGLLAIARVHSLSMSSQSMLSLPPWLYQEQLLQLVSTTGVVHPVTPSQPSICSGLAAKNGLHAYTPPTEHHWSTWQVLHP